MAAQTRPFGMFLQDPSLSELVDDYQFPADKDYLDGMSSSKFVVQDADERGVLLYPGLDWASAADLSYQAFKDGAVDNPQFHQINTFAVASHTLALVEEELGVNLTWREGGPLVLRPHAFQGPNAYYSPSAPSLNFGYFESPFRRAPIWTCLSHDIVAHELGHAILDNYRPLYAYSGNIDVGAIHESMGDLLALFSALEHRQVVARVYQQTEGDMFHPSLVTGLGEEFGIGLFGVMVPYLRSALSGPSYDPSDPAEPHERSTIWTAAMYQILAALVDLQKPKKDAEFFTAITEASKWVKGMLLRALNYTSATGVSMPMLARLIYAADEIVFPADAKFRDIARGIFEERKLWDKSIDLTPPDLGAELEAAANSGSLALTRFVMDHADELRIPIGIGGRLITPRLTTVTRSNDRVKDSKGTSKTVSITERYLNYAYEVVIVKDKGDDVVVLVTYYGGTLALSEDWKPLMLVTDPEIHREDDPGAAGTMQAMARERARFESARRRFGCPLDAQDSTSNWPFRLDKRASGPSRLVRRRCNLNEHVRGVGGRAALLPYAARPVSVSALR